MAAIQATKYQWVTMRVPCKTRLTELFGLVACVEQQANLVLAVRQARRPARGTYFVSAPLTGRV